MKARQKAAKAHPPGQAELAPAERITAWIRARETPANTLTTSDQGECRRFHEKR
jgi:hypothetical protein